MVISHGHKFIFIHNYKVAGTSIREALQHLTIPPDESYYNWIMQKLKVLPSSSTFPDHISAQDLKQKIPAKMFNEYYKFCFVRNPWDWQVSLYHFAKDDPEHFQYELMQKMDFTEYIHWRVSEDKHLQRECMDDENGNCLMDFVGKMENLSEDFDKVCARIGVKSKLPHSNKSAHKNYRSYYTDETRELVAQHFKDDIEAFGYEF